MSQSTYEKHVEGLLQQRQNYSKEDAGKIAHAIMNGTVDRSKGHIAKKPKKEKTGGTRGRAKASQREKLNKLTKVSKQNKITDRFSKKRTPRQKSLPTSSRKPMRRPGGK